MTAVPLHDLDQVATKPDLAELRAHLHAEMAEMKAELKIDIASFQRTMTNWMLTLLVATIGAMASIGFLNWGDGPHRPLRASRIGSSGPYLITQSLYSSRR